MLSAPLSSPLCSTLGRRRTMMTMTIPMTAGWLIITFATDSSMILIGRALCSAVSSISVPAAYSYVAEIANSSNRGFLGSLLSVGWTFGLVISYTLGSVLDWNFLALSACTVPIAQLIVLWVLSMSLPNNFNHQINQSDLLVLLCSLLLWLEIFTDQIYW
jgi:MFS family permease